MMTDTEQSGGTAEVPDQVPDSDVADASSLMS